MQTSAQRSPARKDPAARTVQDPWADQSRHWRDGDAQTANVNCARVEKGGLQTWQPNNRRPANARIGDVGRLTGARKAQLEDLLLAVGSRDVDELTDIVIDLTHARPTSTSIG